MNEDRLKILEMLQEGKISVDEATQLLEASERTRVAEASPESNGPAPILEDEEQQEADNGEPVAQFSSQSKIKLANIRGAYFDGAKLEGARLDGADLTGAYLGSADLRDADLRGANLTGTYLAQANLRNANLQGANLTGAYLEQADFENADLAGVDLTGTHMPRAKYRDGSLTFATEEQDPQPEPMTIHGDVVVR